MTDNQADEIHAELKAIHAKLNDMEKAHAVRVSECFNHGSRTQHLENAVFGNGREGLMQRTTVLETARSSAKWVLVTAAAIAGAIGGLGSAVANLLKG